MPLFDKVRQVCTVVGDFEPTVRNLVDHWGIGPFKCWHFRPPELYDTTLDGHAAPWSMRLAITWLGGVQWEVIEPVDGETLYRRHLTAHGRGVQHLLMSTGAVPFEDAAAHLSARGHPFGQTARVTIPAQIGPVALPRLPQALARPASLHFGYVDAEATLRTSIELTRYPLGIGERRVLRWGKAEFCIPDGDAAFERPLPNRLLRRVVKVGIVTRDLDATVRAWTDVSGVEPWRQHARGGLRAAWAKLDQVLLELVQPDGAGPHRDVLDARGEGVAFLGVRPEKDLSALALRRAGELGYARLGAGPFADDYESVYLAGRQAIGTDLELVDLDAADLWDRVRPS